MSRVVLVVHIVINHQLESIEMHSFKVLVDICSEFTLEFLDETNNKTIEELQKNGATSHVVNLQMVQTQRAIFAVGMFSIFEAKLQEELNCKNGFSKIKKILKNENEINILETFGYFYLAINVLKHGRGGSYDTLISKADLLPFRVKKPDDNFFDEGDVSEISTLVEVDNYFVKHCAKVICDVTEVLRQVDH